MYSNELEKEETDLISQTKAWHLNIATRRNMSVGDMVYVGISLPVLLRLYLCSHKLIEQQHKYYFLFPNNRVVSSLSVSLSLSLRGWMAGSQLQSK